MSLWAAKASIENKGTPLDIAVKRVKDVMAAENEAVMALGMKVIRVDKDDKNLYLCGTYEPIYPKLYVIVPYAFVISLAVGIIFGKWLLMLIPGILGSSYFFYSGTYSYIIFRVMLMKAGYKGRVKRLSGNSMLERYVNKWGRAK